MAADEGNGPDQNRWTEIINRLVDSLGKLAADRIQLAGLQAGRVLSESLALAGIRMAAGAIALLGLVFLSLGAVAWLESVGQSPAAARFLVGAALMALAAAAAAAGRALIGSAAAPAEPAADVRTADARNLAGRSDDSPAIAAEVSRAERLS